MMKKTLFILGVVLLVPFSVAWNQEECEEVNWDHIDCSWGGPTEPNKPLESPRSGSMSHGGGVSLWYITEEEYKSTMLCARSYEVKTFPRSNTYRTTGVSRYYCVDTDVYLKYPLILGIYYKS